MSWEAAVNLFRCNPENKNLARACYFDDPLSSACERYYSSIEWCGIAKLLGSRRGAALDVGAGRGIASYALARDGWATTALEPDPSEIVGAGAIRAMAKESCLQINVIETWGEKLPFADNSFDLVFCRQVLHHANDLLTFCREIHRVLRPGGCLLAIREHVISKPSDLALFLANHPLHKYYGGEHAYTLKEYVDCITAPGMVLSAIINPLESEINTFPLSKDDIKADLAQRYNIPSTRLIPDIVLRLKGAINSTPGRIYSFVAFKSAQ
jgi:SAM-dependent methyltransferase